MSERKVVTAATRRARQMMFGGLALGHVVGITIIGLGLAIEAVGCGTGGLVARGERRVRGGECRGKGGVEAPALSGPEGQGRSRHCSLPCLRPAWPLSHVPVTIAIVAAESALSTFHRRFIDEKSGLTLSSLGRVP